MVEMTWEFRICALHIETSCMKMVSDMLADKLLWTFLLNVRMPPDTSAMNGRTAHTKFIKIQYLIVRNYRSCSLRNVLFSFGNQANFHTLINIP